MTDGDPDRAPRPKFHPLPEWIGPGTRAVHAGARDDANAGAVVFPIYQTSNFHFPAAFSEARDPSGVHLYTRLDNPTQEVAGELLRSLEGAEAARVFGSGMGAISSTLLTFLRPGDEIVALEDLYGGTVDLLRELLPRFGVRVRLLSQAEAERPEDAIGKAARVVYFESPTNPLLRVHDIRRWAAAARAAGAISVFDNTFATPVGQSPLALGVDLVVHSASKYLGGHSDLIAGAVAGSAELVQRVDRTHAVLGSPLDPFAAFLLTRGMKTLPLRVARASANAARVVEALESHPAIARVHYPGRDQPDSEAVAAAQMRFRGGMVAIELRRGQSAVQRFLKRVRLVHVAASLGGVESLASVPRETSHRGLSDADALARGIVPGLVRLSLGIEEADDLVRDLSEALDGV
ncbi:MAG TPA: aminotransferase class I/II-fold pyridoxal phosphate-dependent enzyme [Thermoplasmata archaeon]|jgi:cystathionine beta-lyase/cystathionine gamma-synthase|nr:aminotransferase class I/II-fold pyridoxal phosphate-dependent enzyme [Thermoplasmata archaeon]